MSLLPIASRPNNLVKLDLDVGKIRHHQLFLAYRSQNDLGENSKLLMTLLKEQVEKRR